MRVTGPDCLCKPLCFAKISDEEKQNLISYFNSIADKSKQDTYLAGLIETHSVKRHRSKLGKRQKTCSAKYKIKISLMFVYVCQKAFCSLFGIGKHVVDRIVQQIKNNDFSPKDGRGKHTNRPNVHSHLMNSQIDVPYRYILIVSLQDNLITVEITMLVPNIILQTFQLLKFISYTYKNLNLYIGKPFRKVKLELQNQSLKTVILLEIFKFHLLTQDQIRAKHATDIKMLL